MSDASGGAGRGRAEASRFGPVAALLAASILLSRVLGYARDLLLAHLEGVGANVDAYFIAFLLPDLLNYLLAGGALAIAFIPFYTRVLEERGDDAAGRLFSTVLGTSGFLVVVATSLLFAFAPQLIDSQLTRFDAPTRELTVRLTRIVLPAQVFFVTGGILRAVLMAHGRFREQAAAPLLYNGSIILGGWLGGGVEGFAWGVLVGAGLGNWALPLWGLLRVRPVRLRLAFQDADLGRYLWLAAPLMLGVSLTTVDEWYEKYLGAALATGSVAALGFARKLFMVPVGVIGQALGAAALPILSGLWSSGRASELDAVLERVLRVAVGLGLIAGAGLFALADPIVVVLYQHGRFDAEAAAQVARLLGWMSLATPAWVLQQVAVRAFYAREDTWRPMLLGTGVALAVIPVYLALRSSHGVEGLAVAGVVAMTVNALATLAWARARHGAPQLAALLDATWRGIAVAGPAALAAAWLRPTGVDWTSSVVELACGGGVFVAVAGASLFGLGDPALKELLRARIGRRSGAGREGS